MKILILTNMPSPYQVDVFNAIQQQNRIDIEVIYLRRMSYARKWDQLTNLDHRHVFLEEVRIWKHWYLNKGVVKYFMNSDADGLVVCQYAALSYHIAMVVARCSKLPVVFWSEAVGGVEHAEDPLLPYMWMRNIARAVALSTVRHVCKELWAIGDFAHTSFRNHISKQIPIYTLPYGSRLDEFMDLTPPNIADKVQFLFVGNLSERKGFHLVVVAVRKLIDRMVDNFHITVLGDGVLRDLVDAAIDPYFTFAGFVQGNELRSYFEKCHVLLFPSLYDGWGMSAIEGLAAGLPVLSTSKAGASVQAIRHKVNGYVLSEISSDCLSKGIEWFITNRCDIEAMSCEAKKSAKEFHCTSIASLFEELAFKCFCKDPT